MERFFIYRNRNIAFKVKGEGKTIVFLHGFMESMKIWNGMMKYLSAYYQVVTIDLPGFGKSDNFHKIHTMEFMAEIVNKVLNAIDVRKCLLVGHSMGGYVALSFAEKYAGKVKGLVIFHSHAKADTVEAKINRNRAIKVIDENKGGYIINFIPDLFAPENVSKHKKQIDNLISSSQKFSKKGILASLEGMKHRTDKTHVLTNANFPVLFIVGKLDSRIPYEQIMEQVSMPRQSEMLFLSDVGHMGFIEAKKICQQSIKSFADRVM